MHMRGLLSFSAILLISIWFPYAVSGQAIEINTSHSYAFGDEITFHASFNSAIPIEIAHIFFKSTSDTITNVGEASVIPLGNERYELVYRHSLDDYSIRVFSEVEYQFEITLEGGEVYKSPLSVFNYEDNRFDWEILEAHPFRVHWYEGDTQFGQKILDAAQSGLKHIRSLLELQETEIIDIYVYHNATKMQETLFLSSENWITGHADPDLGVMVVAIPDGPEKQSLMDQRIPHELLHILLFQTTGTGFYNLPTWLNEGLASNAELYPNPDYHLLLDNAVENDTLLPISLLCETFPRDASNAILSYAQSASFTNYLYRTYGKSGLQDLVSAYANGLDCENGAQVAVGKSLSELDRNWQSEELSANVALSTMKNILPWIVLLITVLAVPVGIAISRARQKSDILS